MLAVAESAVIEVDGVSEEPVNPLDILVRQLTLNRGIGRRSGLADPAPRQLAGQLRRRQPVSAVVVAPCDPVITHFVDQTLPGTTPPLVAVLLSRHELSVPVPKRALEEVVREGQARDWYDEDAGHSCSRIAV
jgi:hypothetical protein